MLCLHLSRAFSVLSSNRSITLSSCLRISFFSCGSITSKRTLLADVPELIVIGILRSETSSLIKIYFHIDFSRYISYESYYIHFYRYVNMFLR